MLRYESVLSVEEILVYCCDKLKEAVFKNHIRISWDKSLPLKVAFIHRARPVGRPGFRHPQSVRYEISYCPFCGEKL